MQLQRAISHRDELRAIGYGISMGSKLNFYVYTISPVSFSDFPSGAVQA